MEIRNATQADIEHAIQRTTGHYRDNLRLTRLDRVGYKTIVAYRVRLGVIDSGSAGASINPTTGRRISAACWHAHGDFFTYLLIDVPDAEIRASGRAITRHGGNWVDYGRGSVYYPSVASEWCDCGPVPGRYIHWSSEAKMEAKMKESELS